MSHSNLQPQTSPLPDEAIARALRDSDDRLRSVINSASMVLWAIDADGIFTFSDGGALGLLGLRPGEVVGRSIFEVYRDVPEIVEDNRRALAGEEFTTLRTLGGSTFESRYSVQRGPAGRVVGVIGVAVDVTERRAFEKMLELRAQRSARFQDALMELTRTRSEQLQEALETIVRVDATTLDVQRVSVWLFNEEGSELVCRTLHGGDESSPADIAALRSDVLPDYFHALHQRRVIAAVDAVADPATHEFADSYLIPLGITSMLDVPIWRDGRMVGVVCHEHVGERRSWSSEEQDFAGSIADMVSLALEASERRRAEAALRESEEVLRRSYAELERLVAARTRDLAETNRVLEAQMVERERAESKLLHKSSELEAVFQALPDLYFRLDAAGVFLDYRSGSASGLYAPPEAFLGRTVTEVLPPEVGERVEEGMAEVARTGQLVRLQYSLDYPDGEHAFEARLLPFADDQIITIVRDITEQREAERALQRSEEHFRRITENSSDVASILDHTGVSTYHSPSIERVLGYPPEELVGTSSFQRIHPDDHALCREVLGRMFAEPGSTHTVLFRYRHRDGSWRTLEVLGRTLLPDSPRGGVIINARDVTARIKAEAQLRENEQRFRTVLENASDIITELAPDGTILYESPAMERLLGHSPEQMLGRNAFEFVHPEDAAGTVEAFQRLLVEVGVPQRVEFRFRHRNGSWRSMEAVGTAQLGADGVHSIIVNSRDLTDRREAEKRLRERDELFRRLTENASDLVQVVDPELRIGYSGPSVRHLLGYTPEQIAGTPFFDHLEPEDVYRVAETFEALRAEPGVSRLLEYRVRTADGEWRTLEANCRTLAPDSDAEGLVINARDVTDRKKFEDELKRAKIEAESANRAKSEFLSRMSHELRTPMNSILGFAQLLERRSLAPDEHRGVEHILKGGRHLLNLINEVLDIARIEANRQQLSLEPVRPDGVVQEALSLIRPIALQRGCRVDEHVELPDVYVRADHQRLTQVLLNLLSNAVKYNRPGGSASVIWERAGTEDRPMLRIGVRDTGPGIPPESLARIFEPFERLDAERSGEEGTGLGLTLSRRLVEAMGGTLTVESTVGEGSTFWLELAVEASPLARLASGERPARPVSPASGMRRQATILYIEDNLANLTLVETILESEPEITLIPALQGQLGQELACEHRPDLILLDLHLPDIPGSEVLRRLRSNPGTRDIPVVVISADAMHGSVQRLRSAGADAYLTKPLDVDQFLDTIRRFLEHEKR